MQKYVRPIAAGAVIGAMAAGFLALPSALPRAVANEESTSSLLKSATELFPTPLNGADFVKPGTVVEPWVSTEVLSQSTVKKIGYGRTTYVTISRTATGTYSSDGMASPHVQYPGVTKAREGGSFVAVVTFDGGAAIVRGGSTCVQVSYGFSC